MRAPPIGDGEGDEDLARPRRVAEADLHRVEMRAHEGGVLEVERHVDGRSRPAQLLGRGNNREAAPHRGAEGRAERRVEDGRGVLVLAVLAHDGRLAVGVHGSPEGGHGAAAEEIAQLLSGLDQLLQILDEAPGEGVLDHGNRRHLLDGPGRLAPAVLVDLLHHREHLADSHQWPPPAGPCPLTTSAARAAGGVFRLRPILICPSMSTIEIPKRSPALNASRAVLPTEPTGASTIHRSASRPFAMTPTGRLCTRAVLPVAMQIATSGLAPPSDARWAMTRWIPSGTTPVPDGASLPMMMR